MRILVLFLCVKLGLGLADASAQTVQALIGDRQINIATRCTVWDGTTITLEINEYGNLIYSNRFAKFEIFNGKSDEPTNDRKVEVKVEGNMISVVDAIDDSGGAAFLTKISVTNNACTATYAHETGHLSFEEMDPSCKAVRCYITPKQKAKKK